MSTSTITIRVTDEDKKFLQKMAEFYGLTVSELFKKKTIEQLEDEYDAEIADMAYQNYLDSGCKSSPIEELIKELDL